MESKKPSASIKPPKKTRKTPNRTASPRDGKRSLYRTNTTTDGANSVKKYLKRLKGSGLPQELEHLRSLTSFGDQQSPTDIYNSIKDAPGISPDFNDLDEALDGRLGACGVKSDTMVPRIEKCGYWDDGIGKSGIEGNRGYSVRQNEEMGEFGEDSGILDLIGDIGANGDKDDQRRLKAYGDNREDKEDQESANGNKDGHAPVDLFDIKLPNTNKRKSVSDSTFHPLICPNDEPVSQEERKYIVEHKKLPDRLKMHILNKVGDGHPLSEIRKQFRTLPYIFYKALYQDEDFVSELKHVQANAADELADTLLTIPDTYGDPIRASLKSSNIKWLLSKRFADRYGDKLSIKNETIVRIDETLKNARKRVLDVDYSVSSKKPDDDLM